MIKIKLSADTRQEIDRVRGVLSKAYIIRQEKTAKTAENERFRQYLLVIPKGNKTDENIDIVKKNCR